MLLSLMTVCTIDVVFHILKDLGGVHQEREAQGCSIVCIIMDVISSSENFYVHVCTVF